ncbi:putative metal-dependent HD superfamily phosphohydrolase [Streptosporangium becharense]|uniref:Putative metal-dependent HD superfamily phosphohydrolase n=1 Tax=Streptosporangium becharense TaxID=1816182 RepID=A0A7W9IJS4_9ACTN|nr:metal-dependent phosphohydrolase [Streptosporangium becharense]MBB2910907.1 putative metal-dependent HD superfamily phosphohydrolase [Streptosporangium becharense]MBB5822034.1 putative metal-dependent HD superfamily phosphohydrolase [Streptosporangium becharense]
MSAKLMSLWRSLAGPDAEGLGRELIDRYAEPHRRYHTTAHLEAVLAHVDALAHHADNPDLVRLAAWFHDAVYDPQRGDNEERSARLAERALPEMGLPPEAVATVARLVRLTVTHDPAPGDADGAVLSDADLAILGAPREIYAAYAAAVREEYGFVPEDAFRKGRAAVLRSLLELPAIFRIADLEVAARANIHAELERL